MLEVYEDTEDISKNNNNNNNNNNDYLGGWDGRRNNIINNLTKPVLVEQIYHIIYSALIALMKCYFIRNWKAWSKL